MKRILCAALSAATALLCLTGCKDDAGTAGSTPGTKDSNRISVVTTIFPEYDWAKQIIGDTDAADIKLLLDNGTDLHSYQPSVEDIAKISDCDLFIYVGGESDVWVDDALKSSKNKNMKVINMMDVLGESVKEEEYVEGMQTEDQENDSDSAEEIENDEHVWLSLRNAEVICKSISDSLCEIDAANKDSYKKNSDSYISELDTLDKQYKEAVEKGKHKTLLFGDRFPFRYLTDDYGLDYYAAFVGCSAETEASFNTIAFLAGKLNELGLSHVMTTEKTTSKIAQTIISNSNDKDQKILALDSMQTTNSDDIKNGVTYLSVMQKNLDVLKEALS